MTRARYAAAVLSAVAAACMAAVTATAAPPTDTAALRDAVTLAGVRAHQAQFQVVRQSERWHPGGQHARVSALR